MTILQSGFGVISLNSNLIPQFAEEGMRRVAHAVCGAGAGWPNPRIDLPNPGSSGRGLGFRVQSLEGLGFRA